jgi:hypothetical protein
MIIIIGLLLSNAVFLRSLTFNRKQAELVRIVKDISINERVLIITSANAYNSASTWLPLITDAHVLFSRDAHFVLPRNQAFTIYLHRLALYIFMMGKDIQWARSEMRRPYGLFPTTLPLNKVDIERTIMFEENIFLPIMGRIEAGNDSETIRLLREYDTILVIDDANKPIFSQKNMTKYIKNYREEKINGFSFFWCKPLY